MRVDIDVAIEYQIFSDQPILLQIEAAQTEGQVVVQSVLEIANATLHRISGEGMVGERVWAFGPNQQFIVHYRATVDVSRPFVDLTNLAATPMSALPAEVLTYLRPSRYCQSDLFTDFVGNQFGHLAGGAKIVAILNWIASQISYVSGSSNAGTTAIDTFAVGEGVCRDFAHLLCSFARAANIPARYVSVYGTEVQPPDFHAVAQVWLQGAWHLIDATGMSFAGGLVVIGAGRDAGDVAFMETEQYVQPVDLRISVSQV
jgi:transglutaminase-like putative cysteine protease